MNSAISSRLPSLDNSSHVWYTSLHNFRFRARSTQGEYRAPLRQYAAEKNKFEVRSAQMLKEGFYCALGTPLDEEGGLLPGSLERHILNQIDCGAAGLLLMGTMGMLGCIRDDQYEAAVRTAVAAVNGRVTLLVGAADNSIARMRRRLDILAPYPVSVVLTAPYYFPMTRETALRYFRAAAEWTAHDLYLYDHPWTARYKITLEDVRELASLPQYRGIKTGDPVLIKKLRQAKDLKGDFTPIFSNSDLFELAHAYGIHHTLDGIYACFPRSAGRMQACYDAGDREGGDEAVKTIMGSRDRMFALGIWPSFTAAMNLLGFEGRFGPDYEPVFKAPQDAEKLEAVRRILLDAGEIAP